MTEMRILTVRQPWAWAIIHGGKNVENRSRNVAGSYRGPVAIHVAGKYATEGLNLAALDDACNAWCAAHGCGRQHPWQVNVGQIIGVVELVDAHKCAGTPTNRPRCYEAKANGFSEAVVAGTGLCSPWADQHSENHLVLANSRPLSEPIPFRGGLGLRRLDDETRRQVESRVAS